MTNNSRHLVPLGVVLAFARDDTTQANNVHAQRLTRTTSDAVDLPSIAVDGVCGDLTGDGTVNVEDAIIALRIIAGKVDPTETQSMLGDVVRDGAINIDDVILILRHIVGFVTITECSLTPLPAPSGLNLLPSNDSGLNDTDDITNDSTPTISLKAEPGTLVRLFENGLLVGEVTASSPWEIILQTLNNHGTIHHDMGALFTKLSTINNLAGAM